MNALSSSTSGNPSSSARGSGRNTEQQKVFIRQATILRKNLLDWDYKLRDPRGEDWPTMLGRLNAAMNQAATMDRNIEDVMEHFCYLPKQSTANAQDIPFFLSTRLEQSNVAAAIATEASEAQQKEDEDAGKDAAQLLSEYEERAAKLAADYEESMVRF